MFTILLTSEILCLKSFTFHRPLEFVPNQVQCERAGYNSWYICYILVIDEISFEVKSFRIYNYGLLIINNNTCQWCTVVCIIVNSIQQEWSHILVINILYRDVQQLILFIKQWMFQWRASVELVCCKQKFIGYFHQTSPLGLLQLWQTKSTIVT